MFLELVESFQVGLRQVLVDLPHQQKIAVDVRLLFEQAPGASFFCSICRHEVDAHPRGSAAPQTRLRLLENLHVVIEGCCDKQVLYLVRDSVLSNEVTFLVDLFHLDNQRVQLFQIFEVTQKGHHLSGLRIDSDFSFELACPVH